MIKQSPFILIIFGATGQLAKNKIFPGLLQLYQDNLLPKDFTVIGVGRRFDTNESFRSYLKEHLGSNEKGVNEFIKKVVFHKGDINNLDDFINLKEKIKLYATKTELCPSFLFYLSMTPKYYEQVLSQMKKMDLTNICRAPSNWYRIAIEKPFGDSYESELRIEKKLQEVFKDSQVYRVDHYLGKGILQNILAFRFANNIFNGVWNGNYIEKIEVKILENIEVSDRLDFYDSVGALRDVGQNHILQMLSLATMDIPKSFSSDEVIKEKLKVLKALPVMRKHDIVKYTKRKQSLRFKELIKNSQTETYFKIKIKLESLRWKDVEIILEGGKYLKSTRKEIRVIFKPFNNLFSQNNNLQNEIVFELAPFPSIKAKIFTQSDTLEYKIKTKEFLIEDLQNKFNKSEYYFLIYNLINGNNMFFVSKEEISAMWKFIDPIINGWKDNLVPLEYYN
jgi:glucose-6-phosphate 1-dehydrogenase